MPTGQTTACGDTCSPRTAARATVANASSPPPVLRPRPRHREVHLVAARLDLERQAGRLVPRVLPPDRRRLALGDLAVAQRDRHDEDAVAAGQRPVAGPV